jgi:hypothetical protein
MSQDEHDHDAPIDTPEITSNLITTAWNAASSSASQPVFDFMARPPATSRQEALDNYCKMICAVGSTILLTSHWHRNSTREVPLTNDDPISNSLSLFVH